MKKRMSKILSGLIILTMIVSSTGLAFADENVQNDNDELKTGIIEVENEKSMTQIGETQDNNSIDVDSAVKMSSIDKKMSSKSASLADGFTGKTIISEKTAMPNYKYYAFNQGDEVYIPVKSECEGIMYFDYNIAGTGANKAKISLGYENNGYLYEYSESDVTMSQGQIEENAIYLYVEKGETVYIIVRPDSYNTASISAGFRAKIYTLGTRSLSQGTDYYYLASGCGVDADYKYIESVNWFKITPSTTGKLTVTLKEFGDANGSDGKVELYNSKKTRISNSVYYFSGNKNARAYFGVKAKNTYYLKVTDCSGVEEQCFKYGIKYSVSKATSRDIGSKSKAYKLKRGAATTKTLFIADGKKNIDYYKLYVSSKRTTHIKIDTSGIKSDYVYVTVYYKKSNGKYSTIGSTKINNKYNASYSNGDTYVIINSTSGNKANKGWYYVKVTKGTKASGTYSIKYVK